MKKYLIFLFLCWHSFYSCGQPSDSKLFSLGEIYSDFGRALELEQTVTLYKSFDSFNWMDGAPGPGILSCANCYDVGYNQRNEIVEVLYLDRTSPFNGCRMRIYTTEKYRFMTLEKRSGDVYGFLPIFFVTSIRSREAYMINTRQQTGTNPTARFLFEGAFPLTPLDSISSIMVLDDMFKPKYNVRFSKGTAFLGSEILYSQPNGVFEKERIYLMNFDNGSRKQSISGGLNLRDIPSMFDGASDINFTAMPDINPKFLVYPLWFWGGAYDYK